MKKKSLLTRLLAVTLAALLLLPALPLGLLAEAAEANATLTPGDPPSELAGAEKYYDSAASVRVSDKTSSPYPNATNPQTMLGLEVDLHFYYDPDHAEYQGAKSGVTEGDPVILYVMGTQAERIGTDDDATIVNRLVGRGYYVIVMNYRGDERAVSPYLDWSVQSIKQRIIDGTIVSPHFSDNGKQLVGASYQSYLSNNYVLPAGYDIAYEVPYFSYDLHGAAGSLERIVEIWNNDFKSVKRACLVKWVDEEGLPKLDKTEPLTEEQTSSQDSRKINYATWFTSDTAENGKTTEQLKVLREAGDDSWKNYVYTYIGNTVAEDIYDCVRPNGEFIDLNLYMDIIYPTGIDLTAGTVPVMVAMGSSYHRAAAMTTADRPQLQGFLFQGYVGVVQGYGLVPMCRDDHYGYYCGDSQMNSVSGDNGTYSLANYNSIKSDTAMLRMIRAIGDTGVEYTNDFGTYSLSLSCINGDAIGVFGNSKGGSGSRLGTTSPETLEELRHLPGHVGETRYDHTEAGESASGTDYGALGYTDPYINDPKNTDGNGGKLVRDPVEQPYLGYSSRANLTYAECGAGQATIEVENDLGAQSPIFCTGTQIPGDSSYWVFYRGVMNQARNADVPFYGLLAPNCGHTFGSGIDKYYGIDTYYAFHRYANYWLKGESPSCEIIDVDNPGYIGTDAEGYDASADAPTLTIDRVYEIGAGASVKIQFIGSVSGEEIAKVKIVNALTGAALTGQWTSFFGGQQWEFVPYDIEEGTYYTVTVPADVTANNGKTLGEQTTLTFRTNTAVTDGAEVVEAVSGGENTMNFVFAEKDYSETHSVLLRFTVENEVSNVVSFYPVIGYGTGSETLGEKLGEVAVYGMGAYTFDVTEYAQAHGKEEKIVLRAVAKPAENKPVSATDLSEMTTENVTHLLSGKQDKTQLMNANQSLFVVDTSTFKDDEHGTTIRFDTTLPTASFVNLKGELEGNEITNHSDILTLHSGIFGAAYNGTVTAEMLASLYGKTFTFSFDVYDTTSRQIHVGIQQVESGKVVDFRAPDTTIRTTKDGWKTVSVTLTYDEWISCTVLRKCTLFLSFENKTQTATSSFVPRGPGGRANGENTAASRFATDNGFDIGKYTYLDFVGNGGLSYSTDENGNVIASGTSADNKTGYSSDKSYTITMSGECYYPVYFDNFKVTENVGTVKFGSSAALVSTAVEYDSLPVEKSVTVVDGVTDESGDLLIGGGSYGIDKDSRKVYVGFDLTAYAGKTASVAFKASGVGTSFSIYGLKTAEEWTKDTITATNAPANDPSSSGVDLDKVYGGAPLATYTLIEETETIKLDITDYAKEMKAQGASTLTLIFISETTGAEKTSYDFTTASPSVRAYNSDSGWYEISEAANNDIGEGSFVIYPSYGTNSTRFAPQFELKEALGENWLKGADTDYSASNPEIGKTYRVTFRVKASKAGSFKLGLMKEAWTGPTDAGDGTHVDDYNWGHALYGETEVSKPNAPIVTVNVGTEWQTVVYEFTVDEKMLPILRVMGDVNYYFGVTKLAMQNVGTGFGLTAEDYNNKTKDVWLAVDDLTVQELSGTTKLEIIDAPKDTVKGSYDFTGTNKPTMGIKGGAYFLYNGANKNEIHEEKEGIYQTLTETVDGQDNSFVRLNASSDVMKESSAGFQLSLGGATGTWTEADVGKTYRVTFKLRASQTGSVSLGMRKYMYCYWETDGNGNKIDGKHDPSNWEGSNHAGTTQVVTIEKAGEWQTVTYEFTVVEDMLPTQFRPNNTQTYYQCDRLAIATYDGMNIKNATEAVNIDVDDLIVIEVNEGAKYTGYEKKMTFTDKAENWNEFTNFSMYGSSSEMLYVENGQIHFNPAKSTNPGGNANSNVHVLNSLSEILKSENVGTKYHISFRVKATMEGFLDVGFTASQAVTQGYQKNFYEGENVTPYKAEITEVDTWLRFGFDFTVEEGMLSENLTLEDTTKPTPYFGLAFKCFNGYAEVMTTKKYKDVEFIIDDISIREVETLKDTSSIPVADSVTVTGAGNDDALTTEKGDALPLEQVKKTYLTFTTNEREQIYGATLKLTVTESDGQTVAVYLVGESDPIATFVATVGTHEIDLTELVQKYPKATLTLCFATETIGAAKDVKLSTAGTETPTLVIESAKADPFDTNTFKVKSNLTLASDLCYNLYIPTGVFVKSIALVGETLDLSALPTAVKDGVLYYRVTYAFAAKDAADRVTATVTVTTAEGEKSADYVLSIPAYAKKIVNGSYDDKTKTLMKDMLAYIDAAMTYFNTTNTEKHKTITDVIGEDYKLPDDADVGLVDTLPENSTEAKETIGSVALLLEDTPAFVFYLKEGKEDLADTFSFASAEGAPLKVEKRREDGRTLLVVTTYAYGMNDKLTFTYAGGSGSYNLAKYHSGTDASNTDLKTLTVRLAKYANSANAYKAAAESAQ